MYVVVKCRSHSNLLFLGFVFFAGTRNPDVPQKTYINFCDKHRRTGLFPSLENCDIFFGQKLPKKTETTIVFKRPADVEIKL